MKNLLGSRRSKLTAGTCGDVASVNLGTETGQQFADRVVDGLPGLKTNPRLWTSLRDELSLLAEAAPNPLLSALEHMLEGTGEAIIPIFKERPGLLYATSEYTAFCGLWKRSRGIRAIFNAL